MLQSPLTLLADDVRRLGPDKAEILAQCRAAAETAPPLMGWPAPAPWLTAEPPVSSPVVAEDLPDESEV